MSEELREAIARAYDRKSSAQKGEPDPWSDIFPPDADWEEERFACAQAALDAIKAAGFVVVPKTPLDHHTTSYELHQWETD